MTKKLGTFEFIEDYSSPTKIVNEEELRKIYQNGRHVSAEIPLEYQPHLLLKVDEKTRSKVDLVEIFKEETVKFYCESNK